MFVRHLSVVLVVALAVIVAAATACGSPDPVTATPPIAGPGTKALGGDVSCKADADCDAGEQCVDGVCQLKRCGTQEYRSAAPLGARRFLAVDRELVVVDDALASRGVGVYEVTNGSFAEVSDKRMSFGGRRVLDHAGGDFFGARPEGTAVALENNSVVEVRAGERTAKVDVGFVPVAIAAGDVDGDGIDEVIAAATNGTVAVCNVQTGGACTKRNVSGTVHDVTAGDVDGDGKEEPVLLVDRGGTSFLIVMNFDDAASGQRPTEEVDTGHAGSRLSAGNIDKEGPVEVVVFEDGGFAGFASDTLRVFGRSADGLKELGSSSVAKDAIDLVVDDIDGDGKAEVLVLEGSGIEVFDVVDRSNLRLAFKTQLTGATTPVRLAFADVDGDSPSGTLTGAAELVAGPVIPTAVVVYPPYSRTRSDGVAQIGIGNKESKEDVAATTVTLKASLMLGYEAEFPGIAKVAVLGRVEGQIARTYATGQSVSVGDRFTVDARPELEGADNAVVVLSCACYHAYTYAIDDPSGRLASAGADRKKISMFVPVGGQTALWSLKRYNALAEKLGTLPVVRVPYTIGDPSSYPADRRTLAGAPIPELDLVSTTPQAYRVSDVARTGWQLDVGEKTSNSEVTTIGVSVRGSLRVAGIVAEAEVGASKSEGTTVTIGREASFSGSVPPIRDDVRTPDDEHALYSYGFSPIVYRDYYETKDGVKGGFFVVTYSVVR